MAGPRGGDEDGRAARFALSGWGRFGLIDRETGAEVTPRGRKARALIAVAASRPGAVCPRDRLAALLWSDRGEEQARASLRQALHELRPLAEGDRALLEIGRDHVRVEPGLLSDEAARIERLAGVGDFAGAADAIPDAGTDLLGDLEGASAGFDEWLAAERPVRREALLAAGRAAGEQAMAAGDTAAARTIANRLSAFEPFDEATVRLGLAADAATGETAAIERRYARLREQLSRDLGVDPSAETENLYRGLLRNDSAGVAPTSRGAPTGESPAASVPDPPPRRRRWVRLVAAAALLLVALTAILFAGRDYWRDPAAAAPASIAVLPFRDLSSERDHFAEGVAEEILGQLAREPELRVAGRTFAWAVAADSGDVRTVGDRLDVDYLLEGSVRRDRDHVRVSVALVRAADGIRIWSETYDGRLDDIFLIQYRIGGAVAQNLRRRLVRATAPAGPYATSGEVYRLYLTARSLMRERQSARTVTAIELLRDAVRRDPNYAPAWSRLGAAIAQHQSFAASSRHGAARSQAIAHVRRALALAPDLAEAHAAMAIILGADEPAASGHIRRAAQLDPNDAEIQLYLGHNFAAAGEFERSFHAFIRAAEIDPYYRPAIGTITRVAPSLGEELRARPLIARLEGSGPDSAHFRGHLNWGRGELARAAADFSEALRRIEPHSADFSDKHLAELFRELGFADEARRTAHFDEAIWRLWQGDVPTLNELARRNRSCAPVPICGGEANDHDGIFAALAVKRLLNAGRGRELAELYDRAGLLALSRDHHEDRAAILVANGPLVALALRQAGRTQEAERLLATVDRAIGRILTRGRVPNWFYADSAQTWALQGRHELALAALERALARGWLYGGLFGGETALADIADEPAFRPLRGQPRFELVRRRIRAHFDRERAQIRADRLPGS